MLIYNFFYILIKGTFHQGLIYVLLGTSDLFGKCWGKSAGSHMPQINLCLHNHGQGGLLKKHKKSAKFSSQIMTEINTQ